MRTLTIIIPLFNEEKTITIILEKIKSLNLPSWKKEVIIINDGSSDNSIKLAKKFQNKNKWLQIISQPHSGRGLALRKGINLAKGNVITFQDADLEYEPNDLQKLLKEFENPRVQVVYGSRTINPAKKGYETFVLGSHLLTSLTNLLYNSKLTDLYTGYKLFRSSLVKSIKLESNGFELEPEITSKILKKGITIKELPISYNPRTFKEGKKITAFDGIKGFITILKYRI